MPLLDHFHPPLSVQRHWHGFHSAWAASLARHVNQVLPPRYFAEPNVNLGGQVEIDVGTFEEGRGTTGRQDTGDGTVMTAVGAPSRPALSVPVDLARLETFEVQVFNEEAGPRLVAAIELVTPANKDRPSHRKAFVTKCAAYLQQGISLVLVDGVTSRSANLHLELLRFLEVARTNEEPGSGELYAAAYRTAAYPGELCLEAWTEPLSIGLPLPELPLWIEADYSLPLDLEGSYTAACESLRITAQPQCSYAAGEP